MKRGLCAGAVAAVLGVLAAAVAAAAGPGQTVGSADSALAKSVALERADMERRRGDLLLEEERLKTLRKEIDERLQELRRLKDGIARERAGLEAQEQALSEARRKEFLHLVKVYENMAPEEAAPLIQAMDRNVAVDLLARMKEKKAGQILENVQKKRAVELSEALARRKRPEGP